MMNAMAAEGCIQTCNACASAQRRHSRTAGFSYPLLLSVLMLATLLGAAQEAGAADKDPKPALPAIDDRWVLMPFETGRFIVRNPVTGRSHRIKLDLRKKRWVVGIDGTRLPERLQEGMRKNSKDRLALSDIRVTYSPQSPRSLEIYLHYQGSCEYAILTDKTSTKSITSKCADTDWFYADVSYIMTSKSFIIISRDKENLVLTRCPEFEGCP